MVFVPLLRELELRHYGLYPGKGSDSRFEVKFNSGLALMALSNFMRVNPPYAGLSSRSRVCPAIKKITVRIVANRP
jgi:hypothetical protein